MLISNAIGVGGVRKALLLYLIVTDRLFAAHSGLLAAEFLSVVLISVSGGWRCHHFLCANGSVQLFCLAQCFRKDPHSVIRDLGHPQPPSGSVTSDR